MIITLKLKLLTITGITNLLKTRRFLSEQGTINIFLIYISSYRICHSGHCQ